VDPIILSALGLGSSGFKMAASALSLLRETQKAGPEQSVEELLKLALLTVDRNLVVLDAVKSRVPKEHHEDLLAVSLSLEVEPLAAILIDWPPQDAPDPPKPGKPAEFEKWERELDSLERATQLLAHCRYVVSRLSGLRALSQLPAVVLADMRLSTRYSNIERSHLAIRKLLYRQDSLQHLLQRRSRI